MWAAARVGAAVQRGWLTGGEAMFSRKRMSICSGYGGESGQLREWVAVVEGEWMNTVVDRVATVIERGC